MRTHLVAFPLAFLAGVVAVAAGIAALALVIAPPNFIDICQGSTCAGSQIDQLNAAWAEWRWSVYPALWAMSIGAALAYYFLRSSAWRVTVGSLGLGVVFGAGLVAQGSLVHVVVPYVVPALSNSAMAVRMSVCLTVAAVLFVCAHAVQNGSREKAAVA
jgi:hypothetical protein